MKVLLVLPPCPLARVMVFLHWSIRRAEQVHEHCFRRFKGIGRDTHSSGESVLVSLSLSTMNIVKQSENGNDLSWLITCVLCHWSLVSWSQKPRASSPLLCLSIFSRDMADTGYMSIQAFFGRFRSSVNLPIYLTISVFHLLDRENRQHLQSKTLWAPCTKSQRILKILDSIGCCQRFTGKTSLVHFRISDTSVLQCWCTFPHFKHCKIQPIINLLFILEQRS